MRSVFAIAALAATAAAIKLAEDFPTEGEVMDFAKENGITEEDVAAAIAEYCPECETEDDVVEFLKKNEKKIKAELELAQQSEGEESEGDEPKEKKPKGEDTEGEESEEKKPKGDKPESGSDVESDAELELAQEEESTEDAPKEKKPKGDKPEGDKPECSGAESGSDSDISSGESDVESEEDLDVEELAQEDDVDMADVEKDVKDFIDGLWEHADTNGDGTLDADEGEAALRWAAGKGYITEEEGMAIFDHVAEFAGEDGVVSKDEMFEAGKAAAEEHPEYAEELYRDAKDAIEGADLESETKDFIDEFWTMADTNGDDTIDADEGMAALTLMAESGAIDADEVDAIFAHVAEFAGEDGVVSKEEMFDAAVAAADEAEEFEAEE